MPLFKRSKQPLSSIDPDTSITFPKELAFLDRQSSSASEFTIENDTIKLCIDPLGMSVLELKVKEWIERVDENIVQVDKTVPAEKHNVVISKEEKVRTPKGGMARIVKKIPAVAVTAPATDGSSSSSSSGSDSDEEINEKHTVERDAVTREVVREHDKKTDTVKTRRPDGGIDIHTTETSTEIIPPRKSDPRSLEEYSPIIEIHPDVLMNREQNQNFNSIVGRNANRIAEGAFVLNGRRYDLEKNWKGHFLHGDLTHKPWKLKKHVSSENTKQILGECLSRDGEQGFPCDVRFNACYDITPNQITILLKATNLDKVRSTPISLTQHMYWNLGGNDEDVRMSHMLWINSQFYTQINQELIPSGQILKVDKELDFFTEPKLIGEDMSQRLLDSPLAGYDYNYVLNQRDRDPKSGLVLAAELTHVRTRRYVKIFTTLPGLHLYTGNHLKGQRTREGKSVLPWQAVCLEPQYFPDSINHPHFPSTVVHAGRVWRHEIIYVFGRLD